MKKLFNSKKEKENRNIHLHTYAKKKKKSHRPEYNYPNFKCTVTCQLKNVNANCLEIVLERATIQNLPNMFNKMFVCVCARERAVQVPVEVRDSLGPELQAIMRYSMWRLRIKFRSSSKALYTFNH